MAKLEHGIKDEKRLEEERRRMEESIYKAINSNSNSKDLDKIIDEQIKNLKT